MGVVELAVLPPFGAIEWNAASEDFALAIIDAQDPTAAIIVSNATVVLASADDFRQLPVAQFCRSRSIACIFVIEYTFLTRVGMAIYNGQPWQSRLKTLAWLVANELRLRSAIRKAASVQANGKPAYVAYPSLGLPSHLFFDTRLSRADVISADALERRLSATAQATSIQLAFSGRLIAGKGADALIPLALELRARSAAFELHIYGSGDLSNSIRELIEKHSLREAVILHGAVDFDGELMPQLARTIDLFVCCHRQGDPSCTYAETLGCGVPIAGFNNEALASLVKAFDIGWVVPMGNVRILAALIVKLSSARDELAHKARLARQFALIHNFESEFKGRAVHCAEVASNSNRSLTANQATTK